MTDARARTLIREALCPGFFFAGKGASIRIRHAAREICRWELFRGQLLDAAHTRLERPFELWHVIFAEAGSDDGAVLISVMLDASRSEVHVVRRIEIYRSEGRGSQVPQPPTESDTTWRTERICTIRLKDTRDEAELSHQLATGLRLAVVGTSRLAVTSVESPLPAYSMGRFAYFPDRRSTTQQRPIEGWSELIEVAMTAESTPVERAALLEMVIRSTACGDTRAATRTFIDRCSAIGRNLDDLAPLFRTLFNNLSLMGHPQFIDRLATCLMELAEPDMWGPVAVLDAIGTMLRHLVRHLTAYDLVRFHSRGANYPDALMLDALMHRYLALAERQPHAFETTVGRDRGEPLRAVVRRRAMRQAFLVRCQYEGHLVPDAPTCTGDNERVLHAPHIRMPQAQIEQPQARRKALFSQQNSHDLLTATTRTILQVATDDLEQDRELIELGMAVFLDRPLGVFKEPGEPDRTPLLSYEAFSERIARRRLERWHRAGRINDTQLARAHRRLDTCAPRNGVTVADLTGHSRPGSLALEDARRAAMDFRFLRTTRSSLDGLLCRYNLEPLQAAAPDLWHWLRTSSHVLLIRAPHRIGAEPLLTGFDRNLQAKIELSVRPNRAGRVLYVEIAGIEHPEGGLHVSLPQTKQSAASPDDSVRETTCMLL